MFIVWIGVYPRPFIERIEPTVDVLLGRLERAGATRHLERRARGDRPGARRLSGRSRPALDPRGARGNNSPLSMANLLTRLFGSANERTIKRMQPLVEEIGRLEEEYRALPDSAFPAKTAEWRAR